jgi:hypothetical protein
MRLHGILVLLLTAAPGLAQRLTVMTPLKGEKAYQIAGETFAEYWRKATGREAQVVTYINPYDRNLPAGDIVLIGSDAVNPIVRDLMRRGVVQPFGFEYGGDGYRMLSVPEKNRTLLILAGASGRATIYAVYDFFRRQAGAEYFWDGDVVPRREAIALAGIDVLEKPRFDYRGLRYFAHRGLHRFQAEHWDLEDWKREIDWLLKKRFNLFMLRTGIDDLFQRAFPGQVDYPPENGRDPDAEDRSFNDRTSFWPLRYRGELRRAVLRYAADRGLLHPDDTGTITHWYSHTPSSFYKSHPGFPIITDQKSGYLLPTAAIWDIDNEATWEAYWRLTETHIREFSAGPPRLFHTIGMAERLFGSSDEDNLRRKLYVYRKTQQMIRQQYPDAPLIIAGWDFYGWWKADDVKRLLKEFDPRRTIVMDYTADNLERATYREWGLLNGFPWIFGIFHGYAKHSDSHEDYALLARRLADAVKDDKCLGLTMWSEISHNDTFMLEYLGDNSWKPERTGAAAAVVRYCRTRYPAAVGSEMEKLWPAFLAVSGTAHWTESRTPRAATFHEPQFRVLTSPQFIALDAKRMQEIAGEYKRIRPSLNGAPQYLDALAKLAPTAYDDELWRRDALDMARTTAARALLAGMLDGALAMEAWRVGKGDAERVRKLAGLTERLLGSLGDITGAADEFSMYASLKRLERARSIGGIDPKVNSHSEQTLKSNSENNYCRSHHYEMVRHLYPAELHSYWEWVLKKIESGDKSPWARPAEFAQIGARHRDRFYSTPLAEMAPRQARGAAELARTLANLSALIREMPDGGR